MLYIAGGSITAQDLLFASLLGVAAGVIVSILLQKSWGIKVAVFDALLGPAMGVAIAYAVLELDKYGGIYYSPASVVLPVAIASVALRHLLRLAF
jgi:hypothetical protein